MHRRHQNKLESPTNQNITVIFLEKMGNGYNLSGLSFMVLEFDIAG